MSGSTTTTAKPASKAEDPAAKTQTRFPRILWPVNPLDQIRATAVRVQTLSQIVAPVAVGEANVAVGGTYQISKTNVVDSQKVPYKPDGMYYSLDMDFALAKQDAAILATFKRTAAPKPALTKEQTAESAWGRWLGNPLVDPSTNSLYLMRVRITQLKIEPLMAGFTVKWAIPAGWLWADGGGSKTIVEVVSNPLVIIRRIMSPAVLPKGTTGGFTAAVIAMYPGY